MHEVRAQVARVPVAFDTVERVRAKDAVGQRVHLRGWVHRSRSSGGLLFLTLRDRTGTVPVTVRKDAVGAEKFQAAEHVQLEGAIAVEGLVAEDPRAPGGREVRADQIDIIHAGEPFPIFKDQTEEFLLDKRHLTIRSQEFVQMFRLKAALMGALREFLTEEAVLEVTPPIITGNAAEGGSEAFEFDYFGKPGYLAQTAQLYLEAMLFPHERVYAITPSFRAEKSRTPRHLTEYTHLEVELAWCDLEGLIDFTERMFVTVLHRLAERCPTELKSLGRDPAELSRLTAPFDRITYKDAVELLQSQGFPVKWGSDLGTAEERALTLERTSPRWLTHFPVEVKAFYMLRTPNDPATVEAADLLGPEGFGEIVGASCREVDIDRLTERIKAVGANPAAYEWYLDLRRHGSVPHAGFGTGIERILRWVARREHIRDATPFPRTPARHTP
jgi:asparaginyl-tRNA synthetase